MVAAASGEDPHTTPGASPGVTSSPRSAGTRKRVTASPAGWSDEQIDEMEDVADGYVEFSRYVADEIRYEREH